jgi:TonB family protein
MAAGLLAPPPAQLPATPPPADRPVPTRARSLQPLATLFSMDDYPYAAYQGEAEGVVEFTLVIDARGMPSRCIVTRSSSNDVLDRATCDILMERARFTPARDEEGRAVEDRVRSRVRWVMPARDDFRLAFMPLWILSEVSLAEDGSLLCRDRLNAFEYPDEGEGCGAFGDEDLPARLRALGQRSAISLVITIAPDGAPPPQGDGVDRGEPALAGTARLSVAPDGHVTDCRITRRPDPRGAAGLDELLDLCRLPAFNHEQMFRPDTWRREVGTATLTLRLYLWTASSPLRR